MLEGRLSAHHGCRPPSGANALDAALVPGPITAAELELLTDKLLNGGATEEQEQWIFRPNNLLGLDAAGRGFVVLAHFTVSQWLLSTMNPEMVESTATL